MKRQFGVVVALAATGLLALGSVIPASAVLTGGSISPSSQTRPINVMTASWSVSGTGTNPDRQGRFYFGDGNWTGIGGPTNWTTTVGYTFSHWCEPTTQRTYTQSLRNITGTTTFATSTTTLRRTVTGC